GAPGVRGQGGAESIPFAPMPVGGTLERETKRLRMRNGGHGKGVLHRPLEGTPKTATMQRSSTGTWTVSFSCACVEPLPVPATGQDVGSDVGPKPFAGLSTGDEIASPRFFREEEQALTKAQRRLWNEAKGREHRHEQDGARESLACLSALRGGVVTSHLGTRALASTLLIASPLKTGRSLGWCLPN